MKKVLFLVGSLHGGGAEKVLVDTINHLDRKKYQITIQTLFDEGIFKKELLSHIRYKTIITCSPGICRRIVAKILFFVLGPRITYRWFIRDEYDYEIAFLEGLPTKIISESTNPKARKIAWVHTDLEKFPDSSRAFGSERKEAEAYNRFDQIFCVSGAVMRAFLNKYPMVKIPTDVLYNVIDEEKIIMESQRPVVLPTNIKPCFISAGRLVEQKGYDRLLRIHKRLIEEGCVHSLIILGEGELFKELEAYILDNNLQNTAFLLGFKKNPYKYFNKADCFICSSYAEGFSTVISESVLCGTPVIGTDVAGNREPEEAPRCSLIVENDENALFEALLAVLKNPSILEQYRKELPERQAFLKKENLLSVFESKVFS